jgi:sulfatase-like protein
VSESRQPVWLNGAHLLALWAFALVQPLFDLLGRNADFFVARGSTGGDIVAFALGVTLLPPLLLFGIETLAGLSSPRARDVVHLVFVALLAAAVVLGFVKKAVDGSSGALIPLSLAAGAGLALWYAREEMVRRFASVLAAAPVLFLFLFLFTSPVHKLVLTGEARAESADVDGKVPVIMVSFDEFALTSLLRPDGSIDAQRYPNFARFARQSVWFRNTTTVADGTRWATPIVISGRLPRRDALPTFQDYPQNLFTALGGGYRLHVTEPVTRLCPKRLCSDTGPRESEATGTTGDADADTRDESFWERMRSMTSDLSIVSAHLMLPDDLRERLPSVSEQLGDFAGERKRKAPAALPRRQAPRGSARAQRRIRRATGRRLTELIPAAKEAEQATPAFPRFLRRIRPYRGMGKPPLHFLHVLLPHHPWRLLPSGRVYGPSVPPIPGLRDNVWDSDAEAVNQGWQRHLLQVGYTDRVLGQLMAKLRATGLWDKSLVVLAADHGVAFNPSSPRRKITLDDAGGIAPVPFFMKLPGERDGRVVSEHVETIDVLPTIADALNFELPEDPDGVSALADDYRGRDGVRIWSTTSTAEFERVDLSHADLAARRAEVLARQATLFGTGARNPGLLWAVGPNRELVGRPLAVAARGAGALPARVRYDRPEELEAWTPAARWTPSHVSGQIDGLPAGQDLAISVNGRVRAVARSYDFLGDTRFSFMVPEAAFRTGYNDVRVFAARRAGRRVRLMTLGG